MAIQTYGAASPTAESEIPLEHEHIIRRLFERTYSNGELSAVEGLIAPDYVGHGLATDEVYLGQDGAKRQVTRLRSAVFGLTIDVNGVRATDDGFEVHWTARGRLEHPFMGVDPPCFVSEAGEEPRGPSFSETGVATGRISDGRIREMRMATEVA